MNKCLFCDWIFECCTCRVKNPDFEIQNVSCRYGHYMKVLKIVKCACHCKMDLEEGMRDIHGFKIPGHVNSLKFGDETYSIIDVRAMTKKEFEGKIIKDTRLNWLKVAKRIDKNMINHDVRKKIWDFLGLKPYILRNE